MEVISVTLRLPFHRIVGPARAPLAEALAICLDLIDDDPLRLERAAVTWHGRFCAHAETTTIAGAEASLAALGGLSSPRRAEHARHLATISRSCGLGDVATVLEGWSAARPEVPGPRALELATAPPRAERPSLNPTAA